MTDREAIRTAPVVAGETSLAHLLRAEAAQLFLIGLLNELPHCAASQNMDAWERCAHSVVALIASSAVRKALEEISNG